MAGNSLEQKTALVTGAAKRIGRAIALALADSGVNVVVHYRSSAAEAEEVGGEIRRRGVSAYAVAADLACADERETLIAQAMEQAGPIDILVNSAATFPAGKLRAITFEDLVANLQVNAWAPFVLCREFARQGRGGKIVNILDTRIEGHDPYHVAYIVSKRVLAAFTRMCALEFAPQVTVNAVAPGLILPPAGKDESYLERLKDTVPLRRWGDPEDVAEAVLFLLRSSFITGQVIYVDGGRHLRGPSDGPDPH
jgi:pteridine reductase